MRHTPSSWISPKEELVEVEETQGRWKTIKVYKPDLRRSRHEEYEEQSSLLDDEE